MAEINLLGAIVITLVIISTSLILLNTLGYNIGGIITKRIRDIVQGFFGTIFTSTSSGICEDYSGRLISEAEFRTLLLAVYNGQCGNQRTRVIMSLSLSREDIKDIAYLSDIAQKGELIFYREVIPIGAEALIIQGNQGDIPIKINDEIEIWQEGSPEPDVLIRII